MKVAVNTDKSTRINKTKTDYKIHTVEVVGSKPSAPTIENE